MAGFTRGLDGSIGDLPDNVVETLKGLDAPIGGEDYESLPSFDDIHTEVLQGDDYVNHEGLIDMAHKDGLALTFTEPVQLPSAEGMSGKGGQAEPVVFRAVVATRRGVFTAYGDANPNDTMVDAVIRMAETRAVSRALRTAVNVGSATAPEMPGSTDGVQVE